MSLVERLISEIGRVVAWQQDLRMAIDAIVANLEGAN